MINIYNAIEDLNCTEFYKHKKRLKELIDEAVSDFLNSKKIEYEYVSNCHIVFEEEQEEELEEEELAFAEETTKKTSRKRKGKSKKEENKSNDNKLSSLTISKGTLSPKF